MGAVPGDTPWERRRELGFFPALWATWKETMFRPVEFWRLVRPNGPFADALFYGWLLAAIQTVIGLPFRLLMMNAAMGPAFTQTLNNPDLPKPMRDFLLHYGSSQVGTVAVVGQALGGLVLFPLILIVMAGILHVFCLMFSAGQYGFTGTFRVLCYALAPSVFGFFAAMNPLAGGCIGFLILVYEVVLTIFGIRAVHATTGGRASGAVLTPFVLSFACCCVGMVVAIGGVISASGMH
jgi:hypothetical protein